MDATYPLGVVFPGVPGKKKRTDPSVNPLQSADDQPVAGGDTRQNRKTATKTPKRLFNPHTPPDDTYYLGQMIYTL